MPRNWTHAAGVLWPHLVEAGKARQTITYTEAAQVIGTNPLSVGHALGPIQAYCLENRLAPLTVVVVGKTSGLPGDGFIAWNAQDLPSASEAVRLQNWELVGNPFEGFGADDDETSMARILLDEPQRRGEIYRAVRDRGVLQRIFRLALLDVYEGCALCGLSFRCALEAAHILPWGECNDEEKVDVTNGLLLCSSHHKLFDDDVFTLTPKLTIEYYDPEGLDGRYGATDRTFALALHGRAVGAPLRSTARIDPSFVRRRNGRAG